MIVYSTCAACRTLLHTTNDRDTYHPTCPLPPQPKIDQLCDELGGLYALEATVDCDSVAEVRNHIDRLEAEIEALQSQPPRLREAALAYVAWGWPVFPLKPKLKVPATPHGFQDATLDAERIDKYWTRYPDANIGLPTGVKFDVVDIDVPLGVQSWAKLLADGDEDALILGDHNIHGKVVTASGGQHFYTPPMGGGNLAGVLPGIDYRGKGGYVVAPPSWLGERGRSWSWLVKPSPEIRA